MSDPLEDKFNLIERYIRKELNAEEIIEFQLKLDTNPELAREVDLHKEMHAAIKTTNKEKDFDKILKEKGATYFNELAEPAPTKVQSIRYWWIVAAASLLLLAGGWFLLKDNNLSLSNQELFAQAFEIPVMLDKEREEGIDISTLEKIAHQSYEDSNFAEASKKYDYIVQNGTDMPAIYFYGAISHMKTSPPNYKRSLLYLDRIRAIGNNPYVDGATWYSALAKLQLKERPEAKTLLKDIIDNEKSKYTTKAQKMYNNL